MASQSTGGPAELERANRLKQELSEFATTGPLKGEYGLQRNLFLDSSGPADELETATLLDWFLFDWFDQNGEGVIDRFLASREDLNDLDQEILVDWEDSINSIFEVSSVDKNALRLRELESGDLFPVSASSRLADTPLARGQYLLARLLPLGKRFIFSGPHVVMPDRQAAEQALKMSRALDTISSPESLEQAQQEQCKAFCEYFGCAELSVRADELAATLERFHRYLFFERRKSDPDLRMVEQFLLEFDHDLKGQALPSMDSELARAREVTIICDEFEGLVLLPEYNTFKRVFESDRRDKDVADWRQLVWRYIKDPNIGILAFERVAEQHPEQVESVLRTLLEDKDFSIEHLYAMLLHYKEPAEGFDELKDDQRLWDLLNGGGEGHPSQKKSPPRSAGVQGEARVGKSRYKSTGPASKRKARSESDARSRAKPKSKTKTATASAARSKRRSG